jgi:hypothetical protein
MERVKGIEPSYSAWKAAALPLSYTRIHLSTILSENRYPPRIMCGACFSGSCSGVDLTRRAEGLNRPCRPYSGAILDGPALNMVRFASYS